MGYKGSKYRWWTGRTDEDCIFKRLDRVMCNDKMISAYPIVEVEHLIKSGSDHALKLVNVKSNNENITKSF